MTLPTISALPTAPNRSTMTDAVFSATADAWVAGLDTFTGETNDVASAVNDLATAADASATAAAAAATASTLGTSTTSVAIGTGSKGPFTTQAGKNWVVGTWLTIASAANPANYMTGQVTAYSGTSLTVNVTAVGGSGTKTDWNIALSGEPGATGATGAAGSNGSNGSNGASGIGPWQQIGSTVTTTGASSVTLSIGTGTNYDDLLIVIAGISGSVTANLQMDLSDDNTNWVGANNLKSLTFGASDTVYGAIELPGYRKAAGRWSANVDALNSDRALGSVATGTSAAWRIAAGIAYIKILLSSGTYDANSISVFGRNV